MARPVKTFATICAVGLVALIAIQFVRPEIPHPPVTADLAAPLQVKQILRKSCYDCHSNETRLAWFDQIVPAYWVVANDVKAARSRLNFSEIGKLPPAQQKGTLYEAVNQIQLDAMPLPSYARLHRDAAVTPDQLSALKNYLNPPQPPKAAPTSDLAADDAQYEKWIHGDKHARTVSPAPNAIEFLPDYKNWKAISTTERFDGQTMRVILGNPTAMRAVAENHINPWPDGSTFAKIAWFARDDGQGNLHPGAFFQVEFMIRDRNKYATTKGWGWARWRGTDFTPYGKDAGFSAECVGCHTPVRDSDYVFTLPRGQQPLAGSLPWNPQQWEVITSSVDRQASNMSTLYGNDIAVRYARSSPEHEYPAGSVLALVTWAQQDDPRWFGAKIPAQVKSVEFVKVTAGTSGQTASSYERYAGSPLVSMPVLDGQSAQSRAAYLLSQRAAVMP